MQQEERKLNLSWLNCAQCLGSGSAAEAEIDLHLNSFLIILLEKQSSQHCGDARASPTLHQRGLHMAVLVKEIQGYASVSQGKLLMLSLPNCTVYPVLNRDPRLQIDMIPMKMSMLFFLSLVFPSACPLLSFLSLISKSSLYMSL